MRHTERSVLFTQPPSISHPASQHLFSAPGSCPGVNALLQLLPPSHCPFLPRKCLQVLTQLGRGQITSPGSCSVPSAGWDKAFREKEPSLRRSQGHVVPEVADPARWLSPKASLVTPLDGCSAGSASLLLLAWWDGHCWLDVPVGGCIWVKNDLLVICPAGRKSTVQIPTRVCKTAAWDTARCGGPSPPSSWLLYFPGRHPAPLASLIPRKTTASLEPQKHRVLVTLVTPSWGCFLLLQPTPSKIKNGTGGKGPWVPDPPPSRLFQALSS